MADRAGLIGKIRALPGEVERLVAGVTPEQLTTAYLPGEWTVAQNVHHLVDSHLNSYIRCKLIATEEQPLLKPYDQDRWAVLADASQADIADSLAMLRHLHVRWVVFWESLDEDEWSRTGFHPETGAVSLTTQLRLYAEHGEGHLEQITRTLRGGGVEVVRW